jgi:hypothetical protein
MDHRSPTLWARQVPRWNGSPCIVSGIVIPECIPVGVPSNFIMENLEKRQHSDDFGTNARKPSKFDNL